MKFYIQFITLLNLGIVLLFHQYYFALSFDNQCFERATHAKDVDGPSVDLYRLTTKMLQNEIVSAADCGCNKRVMLWERVVMLNPEFTIAKESRYECTDFHGKTVSHNRVLVVKYMDVDFNEVNTEINGRSAVCKFLYEYSKFHK